MPDPVDAIDAVVGRIGDLGQALESEASAGVATLTADGEDQSTDDATMSVDIESVDVEADDDAIDIDDATVYEVDAADRIEDVGVDADAPADMEADGDTDAGDAADPADADAATAEANANGAANGAAIGAVAAAKPVTVNRGRPRTAEQIARDERIMLVWIEYKKAPTEDLRNQLMLHYSDTARYLAERMHARLPGEVDVDDLIQAANFGLMDSIDAFDLSRGVKFETFCNQRVRGAIFDELRAMDWVPRLVRARTSKVEKARKALEVEFGRKPTDAELCDRLGVDEAEFRKIVRDANPVTTHSLDRKWYETDSSKDIREIDVIKDTKQSSPLKELQRGDLKTLVTKGLSRAERLIVVLYYYENMTMKEIGTTLDLSESRVSQMHSSILARLKAQMLHRDKEFAPAKPAD